MHLHESLSLSFAELGALLGARTLLAKHLLQHKSTDHGGYAVLPFGSEHVFNMNTSCNVNRECGTASCIGGTMALIMSLHNPVDYVHDAPGKLRQLFFTDNMHTITPEQAVRAIDNFLKYGEPRWDKARAKPKVAPKKPAKRKKRT